MWRVRGGQKLLGCVGDLHSLSVYIKLDRSDRGVVWLWVWLFYLRVVCLHTHSGARNSEATTSVCACVCVCVSVFVCVCVCGCVKTLRRSTREESCAKLSSFTSCVRVCVCFFYLRALVRDRER